MKKKKKKKKIILFRDALFSTALSGIIFLLLSLLIINTSFLNPLVKTLLDFNFLDVYYSENFGKSKNVNADIVLINVEHKDRTRIAQLLQQLIVDQPKLIGVNILFKDFLLTEADSVLSDLLHNDKMVITYQIVSDGTIKNHEFFRGDGEEGYANFDFEGRTSVVRDFHGIYIRGSEVHYSFPAKIAKKVLSPETWKKFDYNRKLKSSKVIKYYGNHQHYMTFDFDEFMITPNRFALKDKIVLLGYIGSPTGNSFDVEDKHFTPLNKITSGKSLPDMYGAVIHANIIEMLLRNDFIYKISNFLIAALCLFFGFWTSLYFIWLNKKLKISYRTVRKTVLFIFSIVLVGITLWLFQKGIVLKAAPIILFTFFCAGFVKYYKHLVRYINTKRKFRSYLN